MVIYLNSNPALEAKTNKFKKFLEESFSDVEVTILNNGQLEMEYNSFDSDFLIINLIGGTFNKIDDQKTLIKKAIDYNLKYGDEHPKALLMNVFNNKVKWNDIGEYLDVFKNSWHDFPNSMRDKNIGNQLREMEDTFPYMPKANFRTDERILIRSIKKVFNLRKEFKDCYPGTSAVDFSE